MATQQDRNFDSLIHRLDKVVYDTAKGNWRLKLVQEDLTVLCNTAETLTVWDAGCGFGQISLWLAAQGHHLTLCDVSERMLARAQANFAKAGLSADFHLAGAQQLAPELPLFDLVLFHAVLEWLAQPLPTLTLAADKVRPGGHLSLLFYNRNAVVYKNVLKGGWRLQPILNDSYMGKGSKLTPPNPQYPQDVLAHLAQAGFEIITHTGIRVFHDYLADDIMAITDEVELFALESRFCREPGFRDMGRYIHVLAKRL